MKGCELCPGAARMFCESDQASLCFDCDAKVHGANFLVARHSRVLLCRSCQSPTPWKAAGSRLGPTVSVCDRCSAGRSAIKKAGGDEDEGESREGERVNDDEEVEDVDDDGDEDEMDEESDEEEDEEEEEEEEEEGEEQVVPWSAETPPPPPASSSSSEEEESSSAARNGWLKRMRQNVDLPSPHYSRDQLPYSSSSRPTAALPKHKRWDLVRSGSNQLFGSDRPLT